MRPPIQTFPRKGGRLPLVLGEAVSIVGLQTLNSLALGLTLILQKP
jgi:hypothetical protein